MSIRFCKYNWNIFVFVHIKYDLFYNYCEIISINTSGGPLSALTCCVNVRLLSAIKKISPLIYSQIGLGAGSILRKL